MKNKKTILVLLLTVILPLGVYARGAADNIRGLQEVLLNLYDEMIPLCKDMINIGRAVAGFAALIYISSRVWKHIAAAESIDFYPLLRPFVICFCITFYVPLVLGVMNGILKPISDGTSEMVDNSNKAIKLLLKKKEDAMKDSPIYQMYIGTDKEGDRDKWYRYTHGGSDPKNETWYEGLGNDLRFEIAKSTYRFQNSVKEWMSEVLQVLFEAAALCINTIRTFQLVVLAILGPLVLGLATFDGLQHTLSAWIAKYINIYLWLPVANVFGTIIGKIQENLIKMDIGQIQQTGDTYFSANDTGYLVFLLIGILGYFTVPSVASFVVNAGGGGGLVQRITSLSSSTGGMVSKGISNIADMKQHMNEGLSGKAAGSGVAGSIGRTLGRGGGYLASRISGSGRKKE